MSDGNNGVASAVSADLATLAAGGTAAGQWALDPAGSRVEFYAKNFWGAMTVRGSFTSVSGAAEVGADGSVTGRLVMDAASLNTKNKKRDEHLRSADFFDVEQHPQVVLTIESGQPTGPTELACKGTLEAAGHVSPVEFTAEADQASADAIVLTANFAVDRTTFAMTWRPLGMASLTAHGTAIARFVRA
jgi:polyisoprenoid-binding protein YceI